MAVGVDEIGQRGFPALQLSPMGITEFEYIVKVGVDRVQCGAGAPFGVSVPWHSLLNASVYHSAVKSWIPAWAVVAAAIPTLNRPIITSLLMNNIAVNLRSGLGALEERAPIESGAYLP
jgi:hypothetical protein